MVRGVEPDTAVVSLVNPEDVTELRSSFCNRVHFFTSVDDARSWLDALSPARQHHRRVAQSTFG